MRVYSFIGIYDWNLGEMLIGLDNTVSHAITIRNYTSWDWNLGEMHVLLIGIWMTVSDYNTNPTVIILVGIGIFPKCMFYF